MQTDEYEFDVIHGIANEGIAAGNIRSEDMRWQKS